MISFELNQLVGDKVADKDIKSWLKKIDKVLRLKKNLSISVAIVGDLAIKKLNHMYRGKDKVTDVLSFGEMDSPVERHFSSPDYLGEVVICHPQAKRQAKKASHSVNREIQVLLTHGVMHLLGYDHEIDAEAEVMEGLEKKILK